jgi:hypothetical protein
MDAQNPQCCERLPEGGWDLKKIKPAGETACATSAITPT